jgi:hypothetical protein
MVDHEAEGVDSIVETASPFLHQEKEAAVVLVGKKDRLASVTAENDVVESTGEMNARCTCHVGKIAESVNLSTSKPDPTLVTPHSKASSIKDCNVFSQKAIKQV